MARSEVWGSSLSPARTDELGFGQATLGELLHRREEIEADIRALETKIVRMPAEVTGWQQLG